MVRTQIGESWHRSPYMYLKSGSSWTRALNSSYVWGEWTSPHISMSAPFWTLSDPMKAVPCWLTRPPFLILAHYCSPEITLRGASPGALQCIWSIWLTVRDVNCQGAPWRGETGSRVHGGPVSAETTLPAPVSPRNARGLKYFEGGTPRSRQGPRHECFWPWSKGVTKPYLFHQTCTYSIPYFYIRLIRL